MLEDIFINLEESEDCICAAVIGKYEEIRQILNLVISNYIVDIGDIELYSEDCNGYMDEYALTIINEEDGTTVYCCPLKYEDEYMGYGADVVYILDNCDSKVQRYCETDAEFVIIGEDECDCCFCDCCKNDMRTNYNNSDDDYYVYSIYII